MMASAAGSRPYGIDNVVAQAATQFFDDKRVNFWNSIVWVRTITHTHTLLTTQTGSLLSNDWIWIGWFETLSLSLSHTHIRYL
jgi:hypothetical protein